MDTVALKLAITDSLAGCYSSDGLIIQDDSLAPFLIKDGEGMSGATAGLNSACTLFSFLGKATKYEGNGKKQ